MIQKGDAKDSAYAVEAEDEDEMNMYAEEHDGGMERDQEADSKGTDASGSRAVGGGIYDNVYASAKVTHDGKVFCFPWSSMQLLSIPVLVKWNVHLM